jgi:membrane-associated phospholipid phosphatase
LVWACVASAAAGQAPEVNRALPEEDESSSKKTEMNAPAISTWTNADRKESLIKQLAGDFVSDQKDVWTSPSRLRLSDSIWLIPVSGVTAGLFVTDASYSRHLTRNPSTISRNNNLSNVGVAALIGGAGSMWLLSHKTHNEHWRETGLLAGQAAINSLVTIEAMKYSFGRERPNQGNGDGNFFRGGTSFPSEHAAAAWAVAGVIAHEYPGPLTKILAYGAASAVMYGRVHSLNHYRSDVFVGALIGNLAAAQVYKKLHDPELRGEAWETMSDASREAARGSTRANLGSPYVPLDSWVYPVFNRLIALGYIHTAIQGTQPWTRLECVRLMNEAEDRAASAKEDPQVSSLLDALSTEFARDMELGAGLPNEYVTLDSLYSRVTGISGKPLTDGYFFGQTISNDYGRPYQEGFNSVLGFNGWVAEGPLVGYVQAEYQHSPWAPPLPESARQYMPTWVNLPGTPPATPFAEVDKMQFIDAYLAMNISNWQFSYGKQSLWWGFNQSGPLMFSNNPSPVNMFRINRVSPFTLPYVFNFLGPIKLEWLLGQFSGHEFVYQTNTGIVGQWGQGISRQPFLQGQKISFKPTENFEFSVYVTVVFSGGPTPLTPHYFLKSYSLGNTQISAGEPGNPGDRRSGVNWSYRIPGMRSLSFYGDAFTEDEFSPLGYPRKSAVQAGLYLARIPGIPKLDLRTEGGSTVPPDFPGCTGCFYVNTRYPQGYTNSGSLLGSTLGRGSQGEYAWSTYWFSPRNKLQFSYGHQKLSSPLFPGGGTINRAGVSLNYQLRSKLTLSGAVQFEKWLIPVVHPTTQSDWTSSIGLTFWPHDWSFQSKN